MAPGGGLSSLVDDSEINRSMMDNTSGQDASPGNIPNDFCISRLAPTRGMLKSSSDSCLRGGRSAQPTPKATFQHGAASTTWRHVRDLSDAVRFGVTGGSIVQSPKNATNDLLMMPALVQSRTDDPHIMPAVVSACRDEPQEVQPMLKAKARVFTGIKKCRRAEGMYVSCGESLTGRRVYLHEREKLLVFYQDGRDGEEYAGWWCGESIVSDKVLGFCESSARFFEPPLSGWCFPVPFGVQPTIRFDFCEPPEEKTLKTYAQRQQEVAEEERQRKLTDEVRKQQKAAEKDKRQKKARELRQKKLADEARERRAAAERIRAAELRISGWLHGIDLGIPSWLHGGLGIHLFLSGTLKWEREKKARVDFFGTEWRDRKSVV